MSDSNNYDSDVELRKPDAVAERNLITDEDSNNAETDSDRDSEKDNDNGMVLEELTSVPAEHDRYGESGDKENEKYHSEDPRPGLTLLRQVHYSARAIPDFITTSDKTSTGDAMSFQERDEWLTAVEEEFSTLLSNGTWKTFSNIPTNTRILPSGVILRLKRDFTGLPARFKARLVARRNL